MTGRQEEPALAALVRGPRVPGDRKRLKAAGVELDDVLLQRIHTERPSDFVIVKRAVRARCIDEIPLTAAKERRRHRVAGETRVVEIA